MKLTEELKQKIDAYFESKSEEEVYEILKGYGIDVPQEKNIEERPVGELFEFQGTKLKVEKSHSYSCRGCYFYSMKSCKYQNAKGLGGCDKADRSDNNYVIFVKV